MVKLVMALSYISINKKFIDTKPLKDTLTSLQNPFGTSKLFQACRVNRPAKFEHGEDSGNFI